MAMVAVSSFVGLMLASLFRKSPAEGKRNRGALFLSLAYFSWTLVALYKFFDPDFPSLIHAVSDRVFSSFSNMFLLAALPYFPFSLRLLGRKLHFKPNPEKWVLGVFIFFVITTTFFVGLERAFTTDTVRISVVFLDSFISLFILGAISMAIISAAKTIWKSRLTLTVMATGMVIFTSSQLFLPLSLLFPGVFALYYPVALISVILGITLLGLFSAVYFSYSSHGQPEYGVAPSLRSDFTHAAKMLPVIHQPVGLVVGYDEERKAYYLKITFQSVDGESEDTIFMKKLFKPFANWLAFAAAGLAESTLEHTDMAMIKFRMVELWNKQSTLPLTQDILFHGDGGKFEILIPAEHIQINQGNFLISRFTIKENFKEFSSCFTKESVEKLKKVLDLTDVL
jgi:hypothetical protein